MNVHQFITRTPALRSMLALPRAMRRAWIRHGNNKAYEVVGRMASIVTSDVRIRVEEFDGEFELGPRSHLLQRLLLDGVYEPALVELFLKHLNPALDVIDVGANVGFFTVLAAKKMTTGRILAAEPTRAAFGRLTNNLKLNDVTSKVTTYNGLVSDEDDVSTINIIAGREEYSSMASIVHPSVADQLFSRETIQTRKLDTLVTDTNLRPGIVKIDVEGAETRVLLGARNTLMTFRPIIISELSRPLLKAHGSSPESVIEFLNQCDYDTFDAHDGIARAGQFEFSDLLAIPR